MNPILLNLPMPITTARLIIRPPQIGDGNILNTAIIESFDTLKIHMPWAKEKPSLDESEAVVRKAAANWILKPQDNPDFILLILDKKPRI
jgi:ribosomal-protein-serine acetyltransferase